MSLTVPDPTHGPMSLADAIKARIGCEDNSAPAPHREATSNPANFRAQNCPSFPPGMPTLAGEVEAWRPKS